MKKAILTCLAFFVILTAFTGCTKKEEAKTAEEIAADALRVQFAEEKKQLDAEYDAFLAEIEGNESSFFALLFKEEFEAKRRQLDAELEKALADPLNYERVDPVAEYYRQQEEANQKFLEAMEENRTVVDIDISNPFAGL